MDKKTILIIKLIIVSTLTYFIYKEAGPWTAGAVCFIMVGCDLIGSVVGTNRTTLKILSDSHIELTKVVIGIIEALNSASKKPDKNTTKH